MTPIATTLAPTTPVEAANSDPTSIVEIAIPPLISPNRKPIDSRRRSASLDFCRIIPIKMNSGIAIKMVLFITAQMRCGIIANMPGSAIRPKTTAAPPNVNATGNPNSSSPRQTTNIIKPSITTGFLYLSRELSLFILDFNQRVSSSVACSEGSSNPRYSRIFRNTNPAAETIRKTKASGITDLIRYRWVSPPGSPLISPVI